MPAVHISIWQYLCEKTFSKTKYTKSYYRSALARAAGKGEEKTASLEVMVHRYHNLV